MVISAVGGCIGKESRLDPELPDQNITVQNNVTMENEYRINESKSNQVRLRISHSKEFNKTRQFNVTLNITNPKLNETVIVVFKPEFGSEGRYQTNVTKIFNSMWSQKFSLQVTRNTSYTRMLIQILENNKGAKTADCKIHVLEIKKTACKVTFEAPVGTAK